MHFLHSHLLFITREAQPGVEIIPSWILHALAREFNMVELEGSCLCGAIKIKSSGPILNKVYTRPSNFLLTTASIS